MKYTEGQVFYVMNLLRKKLLNTDTTLLDSSLNQIEEELSELVSSGETVKNNTWSLVTVAESGSINISTGYTTKRLCEQARSIALTGMTLEEIAAKTNEDAQLREQNHQQWLKDHPPRPPKNREEFDILTKWRLTGENSPSLTSEGVLIKAIDVGLIQQVKLDLAYLLPASGINYYSLNRIRFAHIIPPENES